MKLLLEVQLILEVALPFDIELLWRVKSLEVELLLADLEFDLIFESDIESA